jgi:chromosome segregation ATPase
MATTETIMNKPAEHSDLTKQRVAPVTENKVSKSDTTSAAQKDASDILSMLDGLGAQQPITDQVPVDSPLTAEEQARLADLLGEPKPRNNTENHGDLDSVESKTSFEKQEQNKLGGLTTEIPQQSEGVTAEHDTLGREIDGLLTNIQTQLETVIVEHDTLKKQLALNRARVKELENNQPDNEPEKTDWTPKNEDIDHLPLELAKITQWHKKLVVQVQKLLKFAGNASAERESLEKDLDKANKTICNQEKKLQPLKEQLDDYDNIVTDLRTQLVAQTDMLTTTHEKLLHEVTQRREAEQMLRIIKSRFTPLTKTRSNTKSVSKRKK